MPTSVMAVTVSVSDAVPNLSASQPSYTNNTANVIDTPPATGAITYPQSPLGTSVTNTTRTTEATQTYMAASLNKLNVGTTPPAPGTLPVFKG